MSYLVDVIGAQRHNDSPLSPRRGHGCDEEALTPLLLDPFKGEHVIDFVRLLSVASTLRHHHKAGSIGRACSQAEPGGDKAKLATRAFLGCMQIMKGAISARARLSVANAAITSVFGTQNYRLARHSIAVCGSI